MTKCRAARVPAGLRDNEGDLLSRSEARAALVTGAVRRVGAAIVERLASRGFAVVIHGSARSEADAAGLAQALRDRGFHVRHAVADLAESSGVETLLRQGTECFGPLDVLINNASIFEDDAIETFAPERFDRLIAVNLRAPLMLAQGFAAQADGRSDPSIVNILDQRVLAPNPLYLSYTLSKAGLAMATTVLAQALAPRIRVNAVAPGPVLPNAHEGSARFEAEVAEVPLQRSVSLEAVADAIDYLVDARHVTGQTIAVDSGQRLAWRTPDVLASMGK